MKQWVKLGLLVTVAVAASIAAFRFAYWERGYNAIGGEAFVFPLIMIVGGYALGLIGHEEKEDK